MVGGSSKVVEGGSKFGKMVGGGQNKNSKGQKFEKKW